MRTIRPVQPADLPALKTVIGATDMFPPAMLDDMIAPFWDPENTADFWLTDVVRETPIAVAYCAPERMTEGTWNLYLIAVHPDHQSGGRGAALMARVEEMVAERGAHLLLVETSGLPEFERTRGFYDRLEYAREAVIRDFYAPGDDKVVFRKAITAAQPDT